MLKKSRPLTVKRKPWGIRREGESRGIFLDRTERGKGGGAKVEDVTQKMTASTKATVGVKNDLVTKNFTTRWRGQKLDSVALRRGEWKNGKTLKIPGKKEFHKLRMQASKEKTDMEPGAGRATHEKKKKKKKQKKKNKVKTK